MCCAGNISITHFHFVYKNFMCNFMNVQTSFCKPVCSPIAGRYNPGSVYLFLIFMCYRKGPTRHKATSSSWWFSKIRVTNSTRHTRRTFHRCFQTSWASFEWSGLTRSSTVLASGWRAFYVRYWHWTGKAIWLTCKIVQLNMQFPAAMLVI